MQCITRAFSCRGNVEACFSVIASAAKQSRPSPRRDPGLLRCARNDELRELLRRRADRVELVAEENAAGVSYDGHDGKGDASGDQAILDRGGGFLIGKKRPEQNHRQLLMIRSNVGARRYQTGKVIDGHLRASNMQGSARTVPAVS